MSDIDVRATRCFSNVFPNLPPEEIAQASTASVAAWDSVAHVTLLSSISEEFGFDFEFEDFDELVSFALIRDYVEKKSPNA